MVNRTQALVLGFFLIAEADKRANLRRSVSVMSAPQIWGPGRLEVLGCGEHAAADQWPTTASPAGRGVRRERELQRACPTVQDEPDPRGAAGGDLDLLEAVDPGEELGQLRCGGVQDAVAGLVLDYHVGHCAVGGGVPAHHEVPAISSNSI
jgi:hypothetical protein